MGRCAILGVRSQKFNLSGGCHVSLTRSPMTRKIFARTQRPPKASVIAARETAEGNFDPESEGLNPRIPGISSVREYIQNRFKLTLFTRFIDSFLSPPGGWQTQLSGVFLSLCDSKIIQGGFLWPFAESASTRVPRSTAALSVFASNTLNAGVPNAGVFLWARSFARCAKTAWRRSAGRWRPEIPTSSTRERFWTLTKCAARAFTKANFSSMKPSRWFSVASWRRSKRSTARKEGGPLSYPSHSTKSARPLKSVRLASLYPGGPNPPRGHFF